MVNDDFSCIKEVTKVINLTLPAMYNTCEINGICNALEGWKRQYIKQLQGIVVGYKNVSLTSKRGYIKVDSPVIFCNVKATFELFYPTIGSIIKGKVNRINQDYISCLVHNTINVTVYRTSDVSSDISNFIALDTFILFKITRITFKSKFIHVKGKITDECITLMKESGMLNENTNSSVNSKLQCASPEFSNSINNSVFNNPPIFNENVQKTSNFDTSTDTLSQTSQYKKKKKHKKSKESLSTSLSPTSESLANNIDQVELEQSIKNSRKRKRKKSHENLTELSYASEDDTEPVHAKKKLKTEELNFTDVNHVLTQSSSTKKKRHKKSDTNLSPSINMLENEFKPKKSSESYMNDTLEFLEKGSSFFSFDRPNTEENNSIFDAAPAIGSPDAAIKINDSVIKTEPITPTKKKKHKKHKTSFDATPSPNFMLKTEINQNDSPSLTQSFPSPQTTPSSSHTKFEQNTITSPDLFDKPSNEVINKEKSKSKKKKKKDNGSNKNKLHKKKKDKSKKSSKKDKLKLGSKKDKKKKIKVLSTKKKLPGHSSKLKKKKNKDKKSKEAKKNKLKSDK